ncbi:hypothetical protein HHI36_004046 [Cryptolaemus montrouzieri]|uniref:Uncharacterized protein n=1 Tax=Cryptolaemus montrouzieri TaxID=559131 RepID=A0ABD2NQ99_9CUCU
MLNVRMIDSTSSVCNNKVCLLKIIKPKVVFIHPFINFSCFSAIPTLFTLTVNILVVENSSISMKLIAIFFFLHCTLMGNTQAAHSHILNTDRKLLINVY